MKRVSFLSHTTISNGNLRSACLSGIDNRNRCYLHWCNSHSILQLWKKIVSFSFFTFNSQSRKFRMFKNKLTNAYQNPWFIPFSTIQLIGLMRTEKVSLPKGFQNKKIFLHTRSRQLGAFTSYPCEPLREQE